MTAASTVAAGTGFCVRCYAAGHVVLAVDPVAGDECAAHRAGMAVARLAHAAQRHTAERLVAVEDAGQLALTSLSDAGGGRRLVATAAGRTAPPMASVRGVPVGRVAGTSGDTAVETTRSGQDRLALPGVPRGPHATGVQVACARCDERGVDRQGLPFRFAGDPTPLCIPCWRAELQRRDHRDRQQLRAELWEGIGAAEAAAVCPVCGPDAGQALPVGELLPPAAVSARRHRRRRERRRRERVGQVSRAGCWLCGDNVWLWQLRAQFERDQAAAEVEVEQEFTRIAARSEAEDRVQEITAWIDRLQMVLSAYQVGGGRGRAVELLAELIARDAAARTTKRGRPGVLLYVGGVLAVDSDWRSGNRGMPGRARTAELIGCCESAVTPAWRRLSTTLGWAVRTKVGGRLSLDERMATGRWNDRAEFDIVPAHHGDPALRAPHVPAALGILGELLQHAQQLREQAQADVDELRARTGTVTDWPEQVRRAEMRQAVERALRQVTSATAASDLVVNICTPHTVSRGEYLSSCSWWGLVYSRKIMIHSDRCFGQPRSGRGNNGASRSPTGEGRGDLECSGSWCGSPRLTRPRTLKGGSRPSRWARPAWSEWAGPLARDLVKLWPWLDRPGVKRARVVATLGARLGPDWTASALARFVTTRHGRSLLVEPDAPLAYLRHLLEEALTGDAEPPFPARRATEHRRELVGAGGEQQRLGADLARAGYEARDQLAVRGGARTAREELAALRNRLPQGLRRPDRVALLDAAAAEPCEWPEVAQPGSGLPPERSR